MLKTLRPPALPLDVLQAFAERSYGLSGAWSPLEGERDQNYRILGAGGVSATFKVCHPAEGDAITIAGDDYELRTPETAGGGALGSRQPVSHTS